MTCLKFHTVAGQVDTMADGEEEQVIGWACANDDASSKVECIIFKRI